MSQTIEVWDHRRYLRGDTPAKIVEHPNVPEDWGPSLIVERFGIRDHLRIVAVREDESGDVTREILQHGAE